MKWSHLLSPLTPVYGTAVRLRAAAYRTGLLSAVEADIPVVSVGNLTFGGTGKTPTVIALTRDLVLRGRRPAILTRGYGRIGTDPMVLEGPDPEIRVEAAGDEPLELARRCPETPVIIDADRVRGARLAVDLGADLILLDDGFQHLRIRRDLDLLVLDAGDPWGGDRLPPLGRLREPVTALRRATAVLITKIDDPSGRLPERVTSRIAELAPTMPVFGARFTASRIFDGTDWKTPRDLTGKRVLAIAGIGRPEAFRSLLESAGAEIAGHRWFDDHHPYSAVDRRWIEHEALLLDAVPVTTVKDAVKLQAMDPLWVVEAAMVPTDGHWDRLWRLLPESA